MKWLIIFFIMYSTNVLAKLKNETEIGMIESTGNSEIYTVNAKTNNTQKWSRSSINFGGYYIYGESAYTVSARNWNILTKYERELTPKLSIIFGEIIEGNKFTGIKSRYNTDLGPRYFYLKNDSQTFFSELVYRYTIEDRYAPLENTYDHKARLYNEFEHRYSSQMQYKLWLEYIPNFSDGKDYLINTEASLTAILNSTFSLRISYKGMYDNQPASSDFKNYDSITTTSLVAKF